MIEKIMKAVKRSSKRRSVNVTIGAVVGFLLSCIAVMGAEEYLWIKDDAAGEIKFGTEATEPQLSEDPYKNENSWNAGTGVYINNKTLSGTANGKDGGYGRTEGYGVKLDSDILKEFINNGELIGTGGSIGAGITIGETTGTSKAGKIIITNNGILSGKVTERDGMGIGIFRAKRAFEKIINNGIISMKSIGSDTISGIILLEPGDNIINNGTIYGESLIGAAIGIGVLGAKENNALLVNDGLISYGANEQVRGIMAAGNKKLITNNGLIRLTGENMAGIEMSEGRRIYSNKGMILNSGMILLNGDNDSKGYGINLMNEKILMNNGLIKAEVTGTKEIYGIYLRESSDGDIINNGVVIGRGTGDNTGGIFFENHDENKDITNTGVIFGTKGAIVIDRIPGMGGGTGKSNNYGVLVTEEDEAFTGGNKNNLEEKNYGLYITGATGIVTKEDEHNFDTPILISSEYANSEDYTSGTLTNLTRKMYVKNAPITGGSGIGTSTESFVFSGSAGEYDNSILNGKNNTLEVVGEEREVNGSIINAYETAIKFDDNQSNELTLSGTTINGGVVDDSFAVLGSSNSDTLIIQSGDIAYEDKTRNRNSIINGDINMGGGADTLVIGSGTIVNGNLDGGDNSSKDTLTFGIAQKTRNLSMNTENIKIFNNISNFENININANVTLFESANVNGAEEINIGAGGVLNLRIDSTTENSGRYEGHALFGNTGLRINGDTSQVQVDGTITEEENGIYNIGVLNLVTNGLGLNSIIAMDGTTFDDELFVRTNSILDKATLLATTEGIGKAGDIKIEAGKDLKDVIARRVSTGDNYSQLNKIYKGVYSSGNNNFNALKGILTWNGSGEDYTSVSDSKQMAVLLSYLGNIYTKSPYSYSSELSKRSTEMFRDIVGGNEFRPNLNQWMIMGGLTHADGGTKDTYYGQNYHGFDTGTSDTKADMKLIGAYMLGKYGYSENVTLGIAVGGNKSEAKMDMSKVKGNSGYLGAFAENYRGNLTLKAGAGIQYSEYDADRKTIGGYSYNDKYSDMAYDIYLNGRYSNPIGENLFLEPYTTLSYTYIKQDGADEGNKTLAIETDSKSFDYTSAKVGLDLKKVIPHEKGKSTLSAGVSYTRILDGSDEEYITGRFKGGSDFDILVAHKNEHNIGLNVKYALELESGVLFDVKGTYSVERDSHNNSGKNRTKGEWIVGAGLGYKF